MEKDLNLELRKEIIEVALTLENAISNLLISYLNVENTNLKALGNKNNSLSFKNKIDLMLDIAIFSNDDHHKFLILMEFRNQFLHNIDCTSFEKAIEILGKDRGKQLLKYNSSNLGQDLESKYKRSFMSLFRECLDITLKKIEEKFKIVQTRRKTVTDVAEYGKYIIDKDTELFEIIAKQCEPSIKDSRELIAFKAKIMSSMHQFTKIIATNNSYLDLKGRIEELFNTEEKIKAFFK